MAPFDQNPYERIAKETASSPWPWKMFTFTLLIVGVMVIAYFGLGFGYGPFLEKQIADVDTQLASLSQSIPQEDQDKFVTFYSQLVHVRGLLDNHVGTTAIFPILEKNTHTSVYFSGFDLNTSEQRLGLEGFASSYETLSQQLTMLDKVAEIDRYMITESQSVDGRVRFRLNIFFKPTVFTPAQ